MLRAKTGKEPPPVEPINVSTVEEPPPPPRRRRPKPPEGTATAPEAGGHEPDPARPLTDPTPDAGAPHAGAPDPARPLVDPSAGTAMAPADPAQADPPQPVTPPPAGEPQVASRPAHDPPAQRVSADPPSEVAPTPAPAPEPAPAPAPAQVATAATAPAPAPAAGGVSAEQLNGLIDGVLAKLKPVTRALFVGRFDDATGSLEFRLDNPAILERALARQGEFGEVVAGAVGQKVSFKLVAGSSSGSGSAASAGAGRDSSGRHGRSAHDAGPAPRGGDDSDEAEWAGDADYGDIDSLEDADPPLSAAQRLIEAFPGAELITPDA